MALGFQSMLGFWMGGVNLGPPIPKPTDSWSRPGTITTAYTRPPSPTDLWTRPGTVTSTWTKEQT